MLLILIGLEVIVAEELLKVEVKLSEVSEFHRMVYIRMRDQGLTDEEIDELLNTPVYPMG